MTVEHARIYIVDDEPLSRELLGQALCDQHWQVRSFATGNELLRAIDEAPCDIAMVDIGLPDMDGFSLTQALIERSDTGVVMVTARQDLESRVQGLHVGADAYLVKPVDPRELVATVTALLRRIQPASPGAPAPGWAFDPRNWRLTTPDGAEVELTHTECLFLDILIRHHGEAVSRDEIITGLGHSPLYYHGSRLDTMVCRLRNKISAHSADWQPIATSRSYGYAFVTD